MENTNQKPTIIVSASQVEHIQLCHRLHYFNNILRIIPITSSEKMEKGSFGHKLLEYYYKSIKEEINITPDILNRIIELGLNYATELETTQEGRNEIVKAFKDYVGFYQGDSSWKIDEVEAEFTVIIYEDDSIRIGIEGATDLLVTHKRYELPIVVDHKFRSRNITPASRQIQGKLYCLATGRRDFILNSIGLQKSYSVDKRMERYVFNYSDAQIEEFKSNLIESVQEILRNWSRANEGEYIPGRETACFPYGHKCTYWELCEQKPEDWQRLIERDFKKKPENKILREKK